MNGIMTPAKDFLGKHAPEIFTGLGIGGFFGAIVLAVKATPEAKERVDEVKDCMDDPRFIDYVKATWKLYLPCAALSVASTGCIIMSNSVSNKRTAAAAAAYKLTDMAYDEYRDAVLETVGEKKANEIQNRMYEKQGNKSSIKGVDPLDARPLCIDWPSKRFFRATAEEVQEAINRVNWELTHGQGYCSMSEFHLMLGLTESENGNVLGWNARDGLLDVDMSRSITIHGEPCLVVDYDIYPGHSFDKYYN